MKRLDGQAKPLVEQGTKVYALPLGIVPHGVNYNVQAFKDLGLKVPTTFQQLLTLSRQDQGEGQDADRDRRLGAAEHRRGRADHRDEKRLYSSDPTWNTRRLASKTTFASTPGWRATLQRIVDIM